MRTARLIGASVLAVSVLVIAPIAPIAAAQEVPEAGSSLSSDAMAGAALPPIRIGTARPGIAPGLIFANPQPHGKGSQWVGGPTIYDNAGHVIWYKPSTTIHVTEPVTFHGQPALAYHQTTHSFGPWTAGYWVILDQSYRQVARVGNGVDHHEFLMTSQGTVYVDSYHPVKVNLSKFGGSANATVVEAVIQEINVGTGKVMYEWHSLPHVPVTDSYASLKDSRIDYFHLNSIAVDTDGNLVVSGRVLSAVLKINRQTGAVMWQLGGKHSSFQFLGGTGPSYQHDARIVGQNTYSVFDNGNSRNPHYSRGVTYQVDLAKHTARVVDSWRHNPELYSKIEGSNRLLPNGNRLIGWATTGIATEYGGHSVVFESRVVGASSYRTFRSVWNATPRSLPRLAVRRNGTVLTASADWNGATGIVRWELLGGPDAFHLKVLRTIPYTGFQMSQTMAASLNVRVFAVRAVRDGSAPTQSPAVAVP